VAHDTGSTLSPSGSSQGVDAYRTDADSSGVTGSASSREEPVVKKPMVNGAGIIHGKLFEAPAGGKKSSRSSGSGNKSNHKPSADEDHDDMYQKSSHQQLPISNVGAAGSSSSSQRTAASYSKSQKTSSTVKASSSTTTTTSSSSNKKPGNGQSSSSKNSTSKSNGKSSSTKFNSSTGKHKGSTGQGPAISTNRTVGSPSQKPNNVKGNGNTVGSSTTGKNASKKQNHKDQSSSKQRAAMVPQVKSQQASPKPMPGVGGSKRTGSPIVSKMRLANPSSDGGTNNKGTSSSGGYLGTTPSTATNMQDDGVQQLYTSLSGATAAATRLLSKKQSSNTNDRADRATAAVSDRGSGQPALPVAAHQHSKTAINRNAKTPKGMTSAAASSNSSSSRANNIAGQLYMPFRPWSAAAAAAATGAAARVAGSATALYSRVGMAIAPRQATSSQRTGKADSNSSSSSKQADAAGRPSIKKGTALTAVASVADHSSPPSSSNSQGKASTISATPTGSSLTRSKPGGEASRNSKKSNGSSSSPLKTSSGKASTSPVSDDSSIYTPFSQHRQSAPVSSKPIGLRASPLSAAMRAQNSVPPIPSPPATAAASARQNSTLGSKPSSKQGVKPVKKHRCVRVPYYWRTCMTAKTPDSGCKVIKQSLPGGLGEKTPFFPPTKASTGPPGGLSADAAAKTKQQQPRTYKQIMTTPVSAGNPKANTYVAAAQAFITAQLNAMSGVVMPPHVKAAQLFLRTKYFPQMANRHQVPPEVAKNAAAAVAIITNFIQGKVEGIPTCKSLKQAV
jgi:hypothetical protein